MFALTTQKKYLYLDIISVYFVTILIVSNIASSKILDLGPFTFDGGTILFPLSYIFGDILTEVYGYQASRRVIWFGFSSLLIMSLVLYIVQILPPAHDWPNQTAYELILGVTPRIVFGSLLGYFCGEFSNSYVLAKMKIWTKGKWLWTRTIGSTLVGEAVDTVVFATIAFAGLWSWDLFIALVVSNYIFKVGIEILFTPLTYRVVHLLKKKEQCDVYDNETNFNPFRSSET
jgi:hypothetical protein